MFKHSYSLKSQILIVILLMSLGPLLVVGAYSYLTIQKYKTNIQSNQQVEAALQAETISQWFTERIRNVLDISKAMANVNMETDKIQNMALGFKENCGELCESIVVTNPSGLIVADYHTETIGKVNLSYEPWFTPITKENSKVVYTDVLTSAGTGQPIFGFVAPIRAKNGNLIGVALTPVQTNYISNVLKRAMRGETGDAYLVGSDGKLRTKPRFWDSYVENTKVDADYTQFELSTTYLQLLKTGVSNTSVYKNYQNQEVLGVYIPLAENNWGMFLEYQTSEVFGSTRFMEMILYLVLGLTMVIAVVVSVLVSNSIINPLQLLTNSVKRLALGDVNLTGVTTQKLQRLTQRKDELGMIGNAIQQMIDYQQISSHVAEEIANGDLTVEVKLRDPSDKLGLAQQTMIRRLRELVENIQQNMHALEASNRELESFSYSVSHDLRAPLRSMAGYSEVLLEEYADVLDENGKHYLNQIRSSVVRMSGLIDSLLNLSRVTRSELQMTQVDLSSIAHEIDDEMRENNPNRQVITTIADNMVAHGDKQLLQIVFNNLINNAWKFTSHHPSAQIEVGQLDQNGETIYFIRDDGAGFDMAYSQKLFGDFQRLHASSDFEGTGVGLAMVQRIIFRHGGRIWAESVLDQGATFFFTLKK